VTYQVDYLPKLPRNKSIGIGCIGSGFIMADCHLVAYRKAGFHPVAIAARNFERTREVATRHGIANAYADYREMLNDPSVEVVDIAVPPDVQIDVIRKITSRPNRIRGILAQKPLGINFAQALEIVELCERSGIKLAVNQNMRYDLRVCSIKMPLANQSWPPSICVPSHIGCRGKSVKDGSPCES
jgi:predicted dehydrogenase